MTQSLKARSAPPFLLALIGALVLIAAAAAFAAWQVIAEGAGSRRTPLPGAAAGSPAIGGPFTLTDTEGKTVTDETYRGRRMLVLFGFTYCPDVCPTELGEVARAMDLLGPDAAAIQPLFITVDPERDTVEALAAYVHLFHPAIVGLTGSAAQVATAAAAYRVYYEQGAVDALGDYTMNHSAFFYLMGPDGENRAVFGKDTTAEQLAEAIRADLAA